MAIVITNNSPIKTRTGSINLNLSDNENKVFFTDTPSSFYYIVVSYDYSMSLYKVVGNGKLYGHYNNTNYDYRFNFDNYIKIPKLDLNNIVKVDNNYSYIDGNNKISVALCINTIDVLQDNIDNGYIYMETNGEYYLYSGYDPTDLVSNLFWYDFYDRTGSLSYYKPDKFVRGKIYPITVFSSTPLWITVYYDGGSYGFSISKPSTANFRIGLLNIPTNALRIDFSTSPTIYAIDYCSEDYYYLDTNSVFNILRTTGTKNEINSVQKENIQVGNTIVVTKELINKQIKQNSGLSITEAQFLEFFKSPMVYTLKNDSGNITGKEYILQNDTFSGYNGVKIGERNIEILLNDPKVYKRITNKNITFFD